MRISGPITASALVFAGLLISGSVASKVPEGVLAAAMSPTGAPNSAADRSVLPTSAESLRLQANPPQDPGPDATVPIHDVALPNVPTRGIPEIALAAYRNAELSLQASTPNCGMPWHLLAGIGKIESNHAGNGRTEPDGTTRGIIYGPALDGTLPGNEVIKAAEGGYVRAVGPMQFLPGTWTLYAADGNGDNKSDPNNIFDAVLGAGKYLCSGNLDMRDPKQETRAVLRYNNSLDYASKVLSWSNAYKTGGAPPQGELAPIPDTLPNGGMPDGAGSSMSAGETAVIADPATSPDTPAPDTTTDPNPTPTTDALPTDPQNPTGTLVLKIQVMINIPGRAPIPCGVFCPSPLPNVPTIPQTTTPLPTTTTPPDTTTSPIPTPSTTPTPTTTTVAPTTTTPPTPASITSSPSIPPQANNQQPAAPAPTPTEQKPQTPTATTTPKPATPTTTTPPKPPAPQPTPSQTPQAQPTSQQPAAPATPAPKQPQMPTPTTPASNQQPAAPAPAQQSAAPAPAPAPAPATPAPKQQPAAPAPAPAPAPATPAPTTPAPKQQPAAPAPAPAPAPKQQPATQAPAPAPKPQPATPAPNQKPPNPAPKPAPAQPTTPPVPPAPHP